MRKRDIRARLPYFPIRAIIFFTLFPIIAKASDKITSTQWIKNGQTIISSGGAFELGFFTPGNSKKWYVGIWYKNLADHKTIVWVANRNNPLSDSYGILRIGKQGNLVILDELTYVVWSSNYTDALNPVGQLLDSGNFVLREANNEENYLWQSFDYPTDTLLPEMKLGWDLNRGFNRYITSWKSSEDPSMGDFSWKFDPQGSPESFLWKGKTKIFRSGPWNGVIFSGVPEMKLTDIFNFNFISNGDEVCYSFTPRNKSLVSRLYVTPSGEIQRLTWLKTMKTWNLFWFTPKDQCDNYSQCGVDGICDADSSAGCKCPKGFEPKNPTEWYLRDGCKRKVKLDCKNDGFMPLKNLKLPETSRVFVNKSISLDVCEDACRKNCSCTAYANLDVTGGGTGCIIWTGELIDMREYAEGDGRQDLYVRLASSELEAENAGSKRKRKRKRITKVVGYTVGITIGILLCGPSIYFLWKRKSLIRNIWKGKTEQRDPLQRSPNLLAIKRRYTEDFEAHELELPLLNVNTIAMATNNFSDSNKLGEGGFGCVYKGILPNYQEIAVKRLSKKSVQGIEEFMNEVKSIARLQHRNLVRLIGCCIEMDEKMLVYEYMQNKSLDSIIFDEEKSSLLNWKRRFTIICGIARGLLYLHQDSRFRIVHRDLKASNILLDGEMNPKISDFGMARIFGGDQVEANTKRVVGTCGYMSPEYAMDGTFSVKSDAFSFGVLVLEIVSGKKNRGFYYLDNDHNLLGHAWKLYSEGRGLELLDRSAGYSYSLSEVLRCIHVGLLCVQERAEDRPTMASVVLMLGSETEALPQPKGPGFCLTTNGEESCSVNQVTITVLHTR